MEEEFRVWKGSELVGKTKEEIEKSYGVKISATHRGLYEDNCIQVNPIEIDTYIVAEGENKDKKRLNKDRLPST